VRTIEELMKEFKSILDNGRLRQNWIDALEVNELKILRDGFEKLYLGKEQRLGYIMWRNLFLKGLKKIEIINLMN
jgi:hypothetical protein